MSLRVHRLSPRHTPRVKVQWEAAPAPADGVMLTPWVPASCWEMIQMPDPGCPGRAGAEQSRGAVASLGARGSFSACRPRWGLSSLIEHQARQLACAVCSPRAAACQPVCRSWVALPCRLGALSVSPWGHGLCCGAAPAALEQGKLKYLSLRHYVWPVA